MHSACSRCDKPVPVAEETSLALGIPSMFKGLLKGKKGQARGDAELGMARHWLGEFPKLKKHLDKGKGEKVRKWIHKYKLTHLLPGKTEEDIMNLLERARGATGAAARGPKGVAMLGGREGVAGAGGREGVAMLGVPMVVSGAQRDSDQVDFRPAPGYRGEDPPLELTCPISLHLMADPVIASDSRHYERSSLERLFMDQDSASHVLSPITKEVLGPTVYRSLAMRDVIRRWVADHPGWKEVSLQQSDAAVYALFTKMIGTDQESIQRMLAYYSEEDVEAVRRAYILPQLQVQDRAQGYGLLDSPRPVQGGPYDLLDVTEVDPESAGRRAELWGPLDYVPRANWRYPSAGRAQWSSNPRARDQVWPTMSPEPSSSREGTRSPSERPFNGDVQNRRGDRMLQARPAGFGVGALPDGLRMGAQQADSMEEDQEETAVPFDAQAAMDARVRDRMHAIGWDFLSMHKIIQDDVDVPTHMYGQMGAWPKPEREGPNSVKIMALLCLQLNVNRVPLGPAGRADDGVRALYKEVYEILEYPYYDARDEKFDEIIVGTGSTHEVSEARWSNLWGIFQFIRTRMDIEAQVAYRCRPHLPPTLEHFLDAFPWAVEMPKFIGDELRQQGILGYEDFEENYSKQPRFKFLPTG